MSTEDRLSAILADAETQLYLAQQLLTRASQLGRHATDLALAIDVSAASLATVVAAAFFQVRGLRLTSLNIEAGVPELQIEPVDPPAPAPTVSAKRYGCVVCPDFDTDDRQQSLLHEAMHRANGDTGNVWPIHTAAEEDSACGVDHVFTVVNASGFPLSAEPTFRDGNVSVKITAAEGRAPAEGTRCTKPGCGHLFSVHEEKTGICWDCVGTAKGCVNDLSIQEGRS